MGMVEKMLQGKFSSALECRCAAGLSEWRMRRGAGARWHEPEHAGGQRSMEAGSRSFSLTRAMEMEGCAFIFFLCRYNTLECLW
jgi:hypothetical protein